MATRWALIEPARPIPYTMVPNFLGQLNLTPQYPTLTSDIAGNWHWTFGPSLSDRYPSALAFPLGQMAADMGSQIDHRVSADATSQPGVSCSDICHQDTLKYHLPRSLDYRSHHRVLVAF